MKKRCWVEHCFCQIQPYWLYRISYTVKNNILISTLLVRAYFIALSERFIVDWSLLRLSWDHLGAFLVCLLLVWIPMVTCIGVPPVGKVVAPPLLWPSSSKIALKPDATTFPLDFLDLDLTMPDKLFLISVLVQTWLLPRPITAKHFLHSLTWSGSGEEDDWMVEPGNINDLKTSGRSLNPPAPGGLLNLAIWHTVHWQGVPSAALVDGWGDARFWYIGQGGNFLLESGFYKNLIYSV